MGPLVRRGSLVVFLVLCVAAPGVCEEGWGYQIAHELMSPFCPGRTLAACPSGKADELRVWILLQESAGATREAVEEQLVERYGREILPAPAPDDAAGIAGYAVPILALVAGLPLVIWLLSRLTAPSPGQGTQAAGSPRPDGELADIEDAELAAEIDRQLGDLES